MNRIVCELLGVGEHKRQSDGSKYYSVRFLYEDKVSVCFYKNEDLYNALSKLDRLSDICLMGEFKIRDNNSFIFIPQNFEI